MLAPVLLARKDGTTYKALKVCSYLLLGIFAYHKVTGLLSVIQVSYIILAASATKVFSSKLTKSLSAKSMTLALTITMGVHSYRKQVIDSSHILTTGKRV
jgi:hypothetical protein